MNELRHFLTDAVAKGHIPGAVILIATSDRILWKEAFGSRQLVPTQLPMTADTIFDIASVTKVAAALPAILHLYDRGLLDFDTTVGEVFGLDDSYPVAPLTLTELLTHTAGLPLRTYIEQYGTDRAAILEGLCREPLAAEPGTQVAYCNRGFVLLGMIAEKISGMPLDRYVTEHIWQPLGMHETFYNPPARYLPRIAPTEYRDELGACQHGTVHDESCAWLGGVAGHAGAFSTADDLLRFCRMILQKGGTVLRPETVEKSLQVYTHGLNDARGLGWDYFRKAGVFGHTGFTGTSIYLDPPNDLCCIFLTNRVHPTRDTPHIHEIRRTVLRHVFGGETAHFVDSVIKS